jgi:hypothetical protein
MKRSLPASLLVVGLLLLLPGAPVQGLRGQDQDITVSTSAAPRPCGTWSLSALRGTYALSANGWQDLSEINPALPKGYAPVSIIGTLKVNGNGDVTGWGSINAGGLQMSAEFVDSQFGAPKPDCRIPITLAMKIKEFEGVISGPYAYAGVIAGGPSELEILFMMLGTGPGTHVDLNRARRISMHAD